MIVIQIVDGPEAFLVPGQACIRVWRLRDEPAFSCSRTMRATHIPRCTTRATHGTGRNRPNYGNETKVYSRCAGAVKSVPPDGYEAYGSP